MNITTILTSEELKKKIFENPDNLYMIDCIETDICKVITMSVRRLCECLSSEKKNNFIFLEIIRGDDEFMGEPDCPSIIRRGMVCRVIEDDEDFFKPGDIVVTLEDSCVPYCCLEKYYTPTYSVKDYHHNSQVSPLMIKELEVLYDWSEEQH